MMPFEGATQDSSASEEQWPEPAEEARELEPPSAEPESHEEPPVERYPQSVEPDTETDTEPFSRPVAEPSIVKLPMEPPPPPARTPLPRGAVQEAIDHVTHVIHTLNEALDEMEQSLELLEDLERQGEADFRELESLRRALRQFQRPREGGGHHHRGR